MLVPQMLRGEIDKSKKNIKIGFFLHTPFPSSYIFFRLPYAKPLLEALLHCDLVGFHTYDYVGHFLSSCSKILNLPTTPNGVQFVKNGVVKSVHVGAFPIGIDPLAQQTTMKSDQVQKLIKEFQRSHYKDKKVIISVDRLDYIKGLPHKLHAFDMFLKTYPNQIGKVVLVQVAVPSREGVSEYSDLRSQLNKMCGLINSKYAKPGYCPLEFMFRSIDKDTLIALYAIADVCLVTSVRDGMNLVSYEYIACHNKSHGQLVISEFTGAAHSLKGCITINPWDINNTVEGLQRAIEVDADERERNWQKMWKYVNKYTSAYWGQIFCEELARIGSGCVAARKEGNEDVGETRDDDANGYLTTQDDSKDSTIGVV